ncbi:hypothetical protein AMATHDRAFT_54115, partial [Amanita thiersii Skay4041]
MLWTNHFSTILLFGTMVMMTCGAMPVDLFATTRRDQGIQKHKITARAVPTTTCPPMEGPLAKKVLPMSGSKCEQEGGTGAIWFQLSDICYRSEVASIYFGHIVGNCYRVVGEWKIGHEDIIEHLF